MATLRELTPEEQQREEEARQSGLASLAGPARDLGAGRSSPRTGAGGIGPKGGGGYVGLDRYAAANQSATSELGNKVVGSVDRAGSDARGALSSATGAFNAAVGQGEVRSDPSLLARLAGDATGLAGDASAASAFARQRDASYGGPRTLEETSGYAGAQDALRKAEETRTLSGTDQGVAQLSDQSVTGSRTAGGRSLDTALLLGDESLRGRLNTAREGLGALAGEASGASSAAQERAAAAEKTTAKTRDDTRTAIADAQRAFDEQINAHLRNQQVTAYANARAAQDAVRGINFGAGQLPTTGVGGVYRTYDAQGNPVQDTTSPGMAGNVPEFLTGVNGGGLGGDYILPQFDRDLASFGAAQNAAWQRTDPAALAALGVTPAQLQALTNLAPVGQMADVSSGGTKNVNPYSFVEDYWNRIGDPTRFLHVADPNVTLTRENTASSGDYARASALEQLAGPELAQRLLDPAQSGQAGTANLDLVNFDLAGAQGARQRALESLLGRTNATIAGNARNGGSTLFQTLQPIIAPSVNPVKALQDVKPYVIPGYDQSKIFTDPSGQLGTLLHGPAGTPTTSNLTLADLAPSRPAGGTTAAPKLAPGLDPGLAQMSPAQLAALRALPSADLARLEEARRQQLAGLQRVDGLPPIY